MILMKLSVMISFLSQMVKNYLCWMFFSPVYLGIHTMFVKIHKLTEPKTCFHLKTPPQIQEFLFKKSTFFFKR